MELAIDEQGSLVRHIRCLACNEPVSLHISPIPTTEDGFMHTNRELSRTTCEEEKTIALSLLRKFPCILCAVCNDDHLTEVCYDVRDIVTRDLQLFHDQLGIEEHSGGLQGVDLFIHTSTGDIVISILPQVPGSESEDKCLQRSLQEYRSYRQGTVWFYTTAQNVIEAYKRNMGVGDVVRMQEPFTLRAERTRLFVQKFCNLECKRCYARNRVRVNSKRVSSGGPQTCEARAQMPDAEKQAEIRMFYKCFGVLKEFAPKPGDPDPMYSRLSFEFGKIATELGIS